MWKSRKRKELDSIPEPQRGEASHYIVSRRKLGLAFVLLTLVFVGQGLWLSNLQADSRAQARENRARFVESDLALCAAFNQIRADDRATFEASLKRLSQSAQQLVRVLHVDPAIVAKLEQQSRKELQAELARRPPLKCDRLPSLKTIHPQPKVPASVRPAG